MENTIMKSRGLLLHWNKAVGIPNKLFENQFLASFATHRFRNCTPAKPPLVGKGAHVVGDNIDLF